MLSNIATKIFLEDIERIEEKIKEIYYLEQFDIAQGFEQRLSKLRQKLSDLADTNYDVSFLGESDYELTGELVNLEYEIDRFNKEKAPEIRRNLFRDKIKDFISHVHEKDAQEGLKELGLLMKEWEEETPNEAERQEIKEKIAILSLKILEVQAKKGEKVDINILNQFCEKEDLVKILQSELIKVAQSQDSTYRRQILSMAKNLTVEDINNPLLWQTLFGVDNVQVIATEIQKLPENTTKKIEDPSEQSMELVVPQKVSLVENLKNKFLEMTKRTAVYTFADIDPETGEWKNVKVKRAEYPLEMSKEQKVRLVAVEILGDVTEIEKEAFEGCENLQKAIIGEGVERIGRFAFYGCENLQEVNIGEGVKIIESYAFAFTGISSINIPDSVEFIGQDAFLGCKNLQKTNIGVKIIEGYAFERVVAVSSRESSSEGDEPEK